MNALDGWGHIPLCYTVMAGNVNATILLLEANSHLHILEDSVAKHLMENALLEAYLGIHKILVQAGFPLRVLHRLVQRLEIVHALYEDHVRRDAHVVSSLMDLSPDSRHHEQIYVGLSSAEWHWLEQTVHNPSTLAQACRVTVRRCMVSGATFPEHIQKLPVPPRLKDFLLLRDDCDWTARYQNLYVSRDAEQS